MRQCAIRKEYGIHSRSNINNIAIVHCRNVWMKVLESSNSQCREIMLKSTSIRQLQLERANALLGNNMAYIAGPNNSLSLRITDVCVSSYRNSRSLCWQILLVLFPRICIGSISREFGHGQLKTIVQSLGYLLI